MGAEEEIAVKVVDLDHIVLRTTDVERALEFYTGVLGLTPVRVEEWRAGRVRFPSVRVSATAIIDLFEVGSREEEGALDHFCLVVDPVDWQEEICRGLPVTRGPVANFGARGVGQSVYLHDPDSNQIELRYYT